MSTPTLPQDHDIELSPCIRIDLHYKDKEEDDVQDEQQQEHEMNNQVSSNFLSFLNTTQSQRKTGTFMSSSASSSSRCRRKVAACDDMYPVACDDDENNNDDDDEEKQCMHQEPSEQKQQNTSLELEPLSLHSNQDPNDTYGESNEGCLHRLRTMKRPSRFKILMISSLLLIIVWFIWAHHKTLALLFSKDELQERVLNVLRSLNSYPRYQSYSIYTAGLSVWVFGGLSTIPIETAAGMVFGWDAMYMSAAGKFIGALLAFCLGRYGFLADWAYETFGGNQFLQKMKSSAESNPLLISMLLKFTNFPEAIKNYGSAILKPIKLWMFVIGTLTQGILFAALWTYLGVDTTRRLRDPDYPADHLLQILLPLAVFNGFVLVPVAMGAWIRSQK